jgi:hypothetical protein
MFFIGLLMLSTTAIAFAAAYFSVYGLANTFAGVFWSVVVMGASLEAGKLVAASYLYRYWSTTNVVLRTYLMAGVAALMILTSTGIFGYLSTGYQQDVLPLQQKTEQIKLLEDDRTRSLARKTQIDTLIAGGPSLTNLNRANGTIDPNAARTLRETTKARASMVAQYKDEQVQVTKHIADLDTQLLSLKQDVLKVQAHVGPIIYIAQAFGLPADDATKYLIFIIIFAFDPMAVAMTLATNNALRLRKEEKDSKEAGAITPPAAEPELPTPIPEEVQPEPAPVVDEVQPAPVAEEVQPLADAIGPNPNEVLYDWVQNHGTAEPSADEIVDDWVRNHPRYDPAVHESAQEQPEVTVSEPAVHEIEQPEPEVTVSEPEAKAEEAHEPEPAPVQPVISQGRRFRPAHDRWSDMDHSGTKMRELINHHKYLKAKQDNGDTLSAEEAWELNAIEAVLRKHGVDMYL